MRKDRGATLVELIFTMSLMVTVIGTTVVLYAFVAMKTGDSVTKYNSYQQTKDLMTAFSDVASNAIRCRSITVGSVTALKCTMPNSGIDRDGDGIYEQYFPSGVYKTLKESYTAGNRIWFIPSTSPFSLGSAGKFWYRAVRTDDGELTASNIDAKWSYSNGDTPRIYVPGAVTFTQSSSSLYTKVQITIEPSTNTNAAVKGFSGNLGNKLPAIDITRQFFWGSAY